MAMADLSDFGIEGTNATATSAGTTDGGGYDVGYCGRMMLGVVGWTLWSGIAAVVGRRMSGDGGGVTIAGASLDERAKAPQRLPARRRTHVNTMGNEMIVIPALLGSADRAGASIPFRLRWRPV